MSVGEGRTPELGAFVPAVEGEPFGEWELPGMGAAGPGCGEVSATEFCDRWEGWTEANDQRAHIQYRRHMCGRRECPECWSSQWAGPRTVNVVARLAGGRYVHDDGLDRRIIHAVVSPDEERVERINTIQGFYDARREAVDVAREHGIRGGVTVAHGYRVYDDVKTVFREEEPELSLWRWVRENDMPWREQVYWSPHFHVVGLCRDLQAGDGSDGWVVRNFSTGSGVEPNPGVDRRFSPFEGLREAGPYNEMAGVVRYLLSHATFPAGEDRQAVTWYGVLHGTNFCPDEAAAVERKTEPDLGPLSPGSWMVIQRVAEEVVGARRDDGSGESATDDDAETCPVDGCSGSVHDIWSASLFLESDAGRQMPRAVRERVRAAYEWVTGVRKPPPGLKRPQSEEQAREVVEQLVATD